MVLRKNRTIFKRLVLLFLLFEIISTELIRIRVVLDWDYTDYVKICFKTKY